MAYETAELICKPSSLRSLGLVTASTQQGDVGNVPYFTVSIVAASSLTLCETLHAGQRQKVWLDGVLNVAAHRSHGSNCVQPRSKVLTDLPSRSVKLVMRQAAQV
jgi:hypothetical protein